MEYTAPLTKYGAPKIVPQDDPDFDHVVVIALTNGRNAIVPLHPSRDGEAYVDDVANKCHDTVWWVTHFVAGKPSYCVMGGGIRAA